VSLWNVGNHVPAYTASRSHRSDYEVYLSSGCTALWPGRSPSTFRRKVSLPPASCFPLSLTLAVEAVRSSETSMDSYRATWRYIPEDLSNKDLWMACTYEYFVPFRSVPVTTRLKSRSVCCRSDVAKYRIDIGLSLPRIEATGKYEVTGNVLLFPVRSKGEFWAVFCKYRAASLQCGTVNGHSPALSSVSHWRECSLLASSRSSSFLRNMGGFLPDYMASGSRILRGPTSMQLFTNFIQWRPVRSDRTSLSPFMTLCTHKEQLLVAWFEALTAVIMKSSTFWI
jgi:hypothetical protein